MKKTTIVIDTYKQTDLYVNALDLGLNPSDLFEYEEYINKLVVEIDENLKVVGGYLVPHKKSVRKYEEEDYE